MTSITQEAGNRHTAGHYQHESPALGSARQNRYTNPVNTASADRRHSFAVSTLISWYRSGADVEARLPALSTWLGHVDPQATYWYLQASPELLALAARRAAEYRHDREEPP